MGAPTSIARKRTPYVLDGEVETTAFDVLQQYIEGKCSTSKARAVHRRQMSQ